MSFQLTRKRTAAPSCAAAITSGGILITSGRAEAAAQAPGQGHGATPDDQGAGTVPAPGAFEGLFHAPVAAATTLPERKNIASLPDAELTNLLAAFRALGARGVQSINRG